MQDNKLVQELMKAKEGQTSELGNFDTKTEDWLDRQNSLIIRVKEFIRTKVTQKTFESYSNYYKDKEKEKMNVNKSDTSNLFQHL
jgi:lysozyme family protein